jgi:hypothetical protein
MNIITCVFLSLDVVDEMIKKRNISKNEFGSMHVTIEIQNLSLLFYMHFDSQHPMNKDFFIYGKYDKKVTQKRSMSLEIYNLI